MTEKSKTQTKSENKIKDVAESKIKNESKSKKQEEKNKKSDSTKEKSNKNFFQSTTFQYMLMLVVLIIIFVAISIFTTTNTPNHGSAVDGVYNGFMFEKVSGGFWQTTMKTVEGDKEIIFHYHPAELENLKFDKSVLEYLKAAKEAKGFFFVSIRPEIDNNGEAAIAGIEVAKMASRVLGFDNRTKSALTEQNNETPSNIASCEFSSQNAFVIELGLADETTMVVQPYCAQLLGSDLDETIKLADMFVYYASGVMK